MAEAWSWIAVRSLGIVAYGLAAGSVLLGLSRSTRSDGFLDAPTSIALHRTLSWLAVATAIAHALLLLADRAVPFELVQILVPLRSAYRPVAVGLGTLALWGLAAIVIASLASRRAPRLFRWAHRGALGVFLAATFHGILAGTDSGRLPLFLLYGGVTIAVVFLLFLRLFQRVSGAHAQPARNGRAGSDIVA